MTASWFLAFVITPLIVIVGAYTLFLLDERAFRRRHPPQPPAE